MECNISMDNEKKTIKGYRVNINRQELQKYLEFVDKIWDDHNLSEKKFWDIFQSLVESETKIPDGFGTVYIINLIYFKSKGNWPIYDKYAHKALKAIYFGRRPYEIWIPGAPGKTIITKKNGIVANKEVNCMYSEYLWLLDEIFGGHDYETMHGRLIDRALWVYGHATEEYEE